jgi:hypothetical protein
MQADLEQALAAALAAHMCMRMMMAMGVVMIVTRKGMRQPCSTPPTKQAQKPSAHETIL